MAVAVSSGLLPDAWLTTIAVTLALSLVAASPMNREALSIYERFRDSLRRYQHAASRGVRQW